MGWRAAKERRNPPLFGLAPCGVYPATAIAGGAVRSYRTFSPLPGLTISTAPVRRRGRGNRRLAACWDGQAGRYVFCGTGRQRPFEGRRPDVIRHTALWSSDFPLRGCPRSDRPAQQLLNDYSSTPKVQVFGEKQTAPVQSGFVVGIAGFERARLQPRRSRLLNLVIPTKPRQRRVEGSAVRPKH